MNNENLTSLLDEMRPLLIIAGIKKSQIAVRKKNYKIETLLKAFDWLHNLKISPEWENLVVAWNLVPPEMWEQYRILGVEGLREQLILQDAIDAIRKAWKTNRPQVFGTNANKQRTSN